MFNATGNKNGGLIFIAAIFLVLLLCIVFSHFTAGETATQPEVMSGVQEASNANLDLNNADNGVITAKTVENFNDLSWNWNSINRYNAGEVYMCKDNVPGYNLEGKILLSGNSVTIKNPQEVGSTRPFTLTFNGIRNVKDQPYKALLEGNIQWDNPEVKAFSVEAYVDGEKMQGSGANLVNGGNGGDFSIEFDKQIQTPAEICIKVSGS